MAERPLKWSGGGDDLIPAPKGTWCFVPQELQKKSIEVFLVTQNEIDDLCRSKCRENEV